MFRLEPIDDQKIERLWSHLTNHFNVVVHGIGTGMDSNQKRQAVVTVDSKTNQAVFQSLPTKFEGENVVYERGAQASAYTV